LTVDRCASLTSSHRSLGEQDRLALERAVLGGGVAPLLQHLALEQHAVGVGERIARALMPLPGDAQLAEAVRQLPGDGDLLDHVGVVDHGLVDQIVIVEQA
jgi:hypothetical protein